MQLQQRTIKREVVFFGKGLQTGRKVEMRCLPAPAGEGISFTRSDVGFSPEMKLNEGLFPEGSRRRTEISFSGVKLQTLEHFMSALWALGIDNLKIDVRGPELPGLDGSAKDFLSALKESGVEEQAATRRYIEIGETIRIEDGERKITVLPNKSFSVEYTIDYPLDCIKKETFRIELDEASFEKEIAPARTFCMKKEAVFLFLSGMGRGATLENTLVLGNKGPVGTKLRFPNEPVRHKILDLVGDLYMLGMPVTGEFICEKSGHALNARVLKEIYSEYIRKEQ
ncbi:MAG: UDP-3-O-acyl-N-acetylglucosamine deacetylase [Candidatus Omnitrophota bacterium]